MTYNLWSQTATQMLQTGLISQDNMSADRLRVKAAYFDGRALIHNAFRAIIRMF